MFPYSTKDVDLLLTSSQVGLNLGPERQDYVKRFRGEVTGWVALNWMTWGEKKYRCIFVHFWWTQIPQNLWTHIFCESIATAIFWGLWVWGCHGYLLFLCDLFGSHDCSFRCLKAIYAIALLTIKRGMRYEMQVWWWDWHFFSHISWKWACMMFFKHHYFIQTMSGKSLCTRDTRGTSWLIPLERMTSMVNGRRVCFRRSFKVVHTWWNLITFLEYMSS